MFVYVILCMHIFLTCKALIIILTNAMKKIIIFIIKKEILYNIKNNAGEMTSHLKIYHITGHHNFCSHCNKTLAVMLIIFYFNIRYHDLFSILNTNMPQCNIS